MSETSREVIEKLFGEVDFDALEELKASYSTDRLKCAVNLVNATRSTLDDLETSIDLLVSGISELINEEIDDFFEELYSVEEHGEITFLIERVCTDLFFCAQRLSDALRGFLPLKKLIVSSDGDACAGMDDLPEECDSLRENDKIS